MWVPPKIRSIRQEELTAIAPTLWRAQTTVNI
jgi:hypothetical protein